MWVCSNLPDILHTVIPDLTNLKLCYKSCLNLVLQNNIRSVVNKLSLSHTSSKIILIQAFPCLGTGLCRKLNLLGRHEVSLMLFRIFT